MSGQPRSATTSPPGQSPSFLLVCDEWSPTKGGISRFNRSLAATLARSGQPTCCLVESATAEEKLDAKVCGVVLLTADQTPAGPNLFVRTDSVMSLRPNVVIGHDIVSGPAAWTWARRYLNTARLVHVIHTLTYVESYKRDDDAARRAEERERLIRSVAVDADVVAAVGPSLTRSTTAIVGDRVSVVQLDPGMDVPAALASYQRPVPSNPTVLVFGRGRHVQPKGLDIAALSVARLSMPCSRPRPDLFVRGIPAELCDGLRGQLVAASGLARDQVNVRPHTQDHEQLVRDQTRAMVCVLPSRAEGFGLAALEAIAQGTPVLVSDRSGVAETLREHLGRLAEPMIVRVTDNLDVDVPTWTHAIQQVLDEPAKAFDYAFTVRARLCYKLRWDNVADTLVTRLTIPTQRRPTPR